MMHVALIGVLIVHGIAHLPGFAVPWQLITSAELPYRTTILAGRIDIGDVGVRTVGLAWAVAAAAFIALAWSLWAGLPWTRTRRESCSGSARMGSNRNAVLKTGRAFLLAVPGC